MNPPAWGEVWWAELPHVGGRPVVVLARDVAMRGTGRCMIAPCTTTIRGLASEVALEPGDDPVIKPSAVNLDSVETVPVALLVQRLGALSPTRMSQVCAALAVATGCA